MAGEDVCHSHDGHRLFCLDTEGHAFLFDAPRAIQRDAQSVFLAHDVARPEVFLRKLISGGKVEIRKIAMACRRIPALSDGIENEIRRIEHFRTVMEAVQVVMVGHDGKRVIRNTGAHVVPPADELEHEGFILVGDGIGTAGRRIAPFVDEFHQNPCAFTGRAGAFGKRTMSVMQFILSLSSMQLPPQIVKGSGQSSDHSPLYYHRKSQVSTIVFLLFDV